MSDADLLSLYSDQIMAFAADIPRTGYLEAPYGEGRARAPQCGSSITVQLRLSEAGIEDYAQDVRACLLGQAAASVLGEQAIGCTRAQIQAARDALALMLTQDGPTPPAPFQDLEMLRAAQAHKHRHASILLAFDATLAAFDAA